MWHEMPRQSIAGILLIAAFALSISSCASETPTAPGPASNPAAPAPLPLPKPESVCPNTPCASALWISSMGLQDMGAESDRWRYQASLYLQERGGANVTVTNIHVQVGLGSEVLASPSVNRAVPVPAKSTVNTALAFATGAHFPISDLNADVSVEFRDEEGNIHSVRASFSGFGSWDY